MAAPRITPDVARRYFRECKLTGPEDLVTAINDFVLFQASKRQRGERETLRNRYLVEASACLPPEMPRHTRARWIEKELLRSATRRPSPIAPWESEFRALIDLAKPIKLRLPSLRHIDRILEDAEKRASVDISQIGPVKATSGT